MGVQLQGYIEASRKELSSTTRENLPCELLNLEGLWKVPVSSGRLDGRARALERQFSYFLALGSNLRALCDQSYLEGYEESGWDLTDNLSTNQTTMLSLSGSKTSDGKNSSHCFSNTWNYGSSVYAWETGLEKRRERRGEELGPSTLMRGDDREGSHENLVWKLGIKYFSASVYPRQVDLS